MNSLEKKGLIKPIGSKEYRGNVYPTYWLTEEGILKAIRLGVPPTNVLSSGERLYPDESQDWNFFRDLSYELGDLKFRQLTKDFIAYEKGELRIKGLPYEKEDAQPILQAIFRVARKHPKYWRIMKRITQSCKKALEELFDEDVRIEASTTVGLRVTMRSADSAVADRRILL